MAKKSLTGQLNMFDLFKSLDNEPMGEVQMVSLMPDDVPEEVIEPELEQVPVPEAEEISEPAEVSVSEVEPPPQKKPRVRKVEKHESPVMCRQYDIEGKQLEIAYINYNKVRITRAGEEPEIHVFDSSKEAVDYYVQKMQELEPEE